MCFALVLFSVSYVLVLIDKVETANIKVLQNNRKIYRYGNFIVTYFLIIQNRKEQRCVILTNSLKLYKTINTRKAGNLRLGM